MSILNPFQRLCLLCRLLSDTTHSICSECAQAIATLSPSTLCLRCGIPHPGGLTACCGHCINKPPAFDYTIPVFAYHPPLAHLITQLKFHAQLAAEPWLSNALLERLREFYHHQPLPEVIVPIPLYSRRLWQRGFNQAQLLAEPLAKALNRPLSTTLLSKQRDTKAQSSLSANLRVANLRKAFVTKPHPWSHIAVLDDVMTTGTTADTAAVVLKRAGAQRVDIWCIARALPLA